MNLSNPQRVIKLIKDLVARPSYLPRYLSCLPIWKRSPMNLAMPWWSFSAIDFVGRQCRADQDVFEFGSGGSTIFFAKRCKTVTAVEDEASWHQALTAALRAARVENVEVLLRPFDFRKRENFAASEYLHGLFGKKYDIIVVDGQDWEGDMRPVCFARAEDYIREGGMIIVDDSWKYLQLRERNRAKSWRVFESVGPCRVGVTSTDVYLY